MIRVLSHNTVERKIIVRSAHIYVIGALLMMLDQLQDIEISEYKSEWERILSMI